MRTEYGCVETFLWDDIELQVTFDFTPGSPAITGGPPDGWAPADPNEVEVREVMIRPKGYTDWMPTDIKKWDDDSIERMIEDMGL